MSARAVETADAFRSRYPEAVAVLEAGVREGVAPGFVAGVFRRDEATAPGGPPERDDFDLFAVGNRRLRLKGLDAQPMEIDTIFDLASVSKIMSSATLAAAMVERRWLEYETPVRAILPDFRHDRVTIAHLLSHTAGLPAWFPFFERMRARFGGDPLETRSIAERQRAMRELVFAADLERSPGQKAVYSDLTFLALGFALETITQMPFPQAVRKHVWEPMGLYERDGQGPYYVRADRAAFRIRDERAAATEDCPWRKTILQGQVHDDNCWSMGGYGGHAGVFGRTRDALGFAKSLLDGYHDRRGPLSRGTIARMWTRAYGTERTLGWDTPSGDEPAFGKKFSPTSVGHLGFTGTSLWIDPPRGLAVALFSNRVHPSRDNILIRAFRPRFHEALARDLA